MVITGTFHVSAYAQNSQVCRNITKIHDLVECHRILFNRNSAVFPMSELLKELADDAELACTKSQASVQPARPATGDLRCMFRVSLGADGLEDVETTQSDWMALTFNVVEGSNDDHLELSRSLTRESNWDDEAVVLAHFDLKSQITMNGLFESAFKPIRPRVTCASCHVPVGRESVSLEGYQVWPLKHIPFDRTVRGQIPKNGPLTPNELKTWLLDRWNIENCEKIENETCRRLEVLRSVSRFIERF